MARNVFWRDVHPKHRGRIHVFFGALDESLTIRVCITGLLVSKPQSFCAVARSKPQASTLEACGLDCLGGLPGGRSGEENGEGHTCRGGPSSYPGSPPAGLSGGSAPRTPWEPTRDAPEPSGKPTKMQNCSRPFRRIDFGVTIQIVRSRGR